MAPLRQQRRLAYPCAQVFDLVADIESYPRFVPHYRTARIVQRSNSRLVVDQTLSIGGANLDLRTEAELERPEWIRVRSRRWPLRRLEVDWRFTPDADGCLVAFSLELALALPGLVGLGRPWSQRAAARTLAAFEAEAARRFSAPGDNAPQ